MVGNLEVSIKCPAMTRKWLEVTRSRKGPQNEYKKSPDVTAENYWKLTVMTRK